MNIKLKNIVAQLAKDKKSALDELYTFYYPRLYCFAKGFLKVEDDINDILQEVFVKLWMNRKNIKDVETFNAYIFTITKNLIVSYFRQKIKQRDFEAQVQTLAINKSGNLYDEIEYKDLKEKVDLFVEDLPEKRKQVYNLSREKGLSNKEIAKELGISVKTVEDHITHAIKYLKTKLKTLGEISNLFISIFL